MRAAPAGAEVGLYVDLRERVFVGDVIETQSGRRYAVVDVRVQARGKHRGRQHLRAVVLGEDDPGPMGGVYAQQNGDGFDVWVPRTHKIHWYPRGKVRR